MLLTRLLTRMRPKALAAQAQAFLDGAETETNEKENEGR